MTTNTANTPDAALVNPPDRRASIGGRRFTLSREGGLVILIIIISVISAIAYPRTFPTYGNFASIARNLATDGIMAVGMMVLMISGTFDLSVGGMFSMSGVIVGALMMKSHLPVPLAIALTIVIVLFAGFCNGFVVARVRVNALITTLGAMGIFRGFAVLIGGTSIANLPDEFANLGQAEFPQLIQSPVWMLLILTVLFSYLLSRTRFFRQYYYIGTNPKAASLSGINVERMQIVGFMISALMAGIAGIAFASRVGTSVSTAGDNAELRVITAVILGGASLAGGKGNALGALIGIIFIALIGNVMIIASVDPYWQSIIIGAVLVAAVALDSVVNRT